MNFKKILMSILCVSFTVLYSQSDSLSKFHLEATKEISKTSKFDTLSIFIVVAFISLLFAIVFGSYKLISKIQNMQRDDNTKINDELKRIETSIKDTLKAFNISCNKRGDITKGTLDEGLDYLSTSIENLFNAIHELMGGDATSVPTYIASFFFSTVMDLHCLKKSSLLFDKCKNSSGTPDEVLAILSNEFRQITEDEKTWLDKIKYKNNHTLGEELEFILIKDNWDNFINTNVSFLVKKFLGKNPSWIQVKEETTAMFMDLITPMKKNIREKGGM